MARILVVDDHEDSREVLQAILTAASHEVFLASDGLEGIARYRQARPDVLVADIFMPGVDGLGLISRVREEFPDARIIAISAGLRTTGTDLLDLAQDAGADLVLRKPLEPRGLLQAVDRLLA
jgi:CheY-like chemotaxis protein